MAEATRERNARSRGATARAKYDEWRKACCIVVAEREALRDTLDEMLRDAGYVNVHATTWIADLPRLTAQLAPDLLVIDLSSLRDEDFGIIGRVRAQSRAHVYLPIVVMTEDDSVESKRRALGAGASEFLIKPVDGVELLLRMEKELRTRWLTLELEWKNRTLETRVAERTHRLTQTLGALQRISEQRRELLDRLVHVQEEERRRIAADVHDDTVQAIIGVDLQLQTIRRKVSDPAVVRELAKADELMQAAMRRLRTLLVALRPDMLDRRGLVYALSEYLRQNERADGPRFELRNALRWEPPRDTGSALYRIAVEAASNAQRHANAQSVLIALDQRGDRFYLSVSDDGSGFDPERSETSKPGHIGLATMRDRAELAGGWLRIDSAPGRGTRVEAELPASPGRGTTLWLTDEERVQISA